MKSRQYVILALIVITFSLTYINYGVVKHLNFQTHAFDLGIYSQISWLYSQNLTSFSTLKHMPLLADHFEPILWLISPLYKVFPSPNTLLVIQALFVSFSAIPLYLIAEKLLKNKALAYVIIISYLSSVGIINAIKFEFHTTALSVLPISLVLYAWIEKKWKLYAFSLIFGFLIKEDVSFMMIGLGLYQFILGQKRLGALTILSACSYFFLIKFFLMPFIWKGADQGYIVSSLLPLTSPIDLILLAVTKPTIYLDIFFNSSVKQTTFININEPYAFFALLSPLNWLTVFPILYLRFSATSSHFWTSVFHYNANLMPFVVMSTILTIKNWKLPIKPTIILFTILLFITGLSPSSILWESPQRKVTTERNFRIDTMSKIPPTESVSAQSALVPQLAHRQKIYMYPEVLDSNYIIFDKNLDPYPIDQKQLDKTITNYRNSNYWKVLTEKQSMIIFERKEKLTP